MVESLIAHRPPTSADAAIQLAEMRAEVLRLLIPLVAIGFLAWQGAYVFNTTSDAEVIRSLAITLILGPSLGAAQFLLPRNGTLAATIFVIGGFLAIVAAILLVGSAQGAMLYVTLAFVAAFVIRPLGGALVVVATVVALVLLAEYRPTLISSADVLTIGLSTASVVVGVWVLMRHLRQALEWYVEGYAEAERQRREAREHRGQLALALKQLDLAYHRLERTNAALHFAWKAADAAERSRMELATNISHEMRTPLNLIAGYSEMMLMSPVSYGNVGLPGPYRRDLHAVYRSAQHLLAMTDDIFDLARLEVGRLGLLREPADIREIVVDAAALVTDYVEAKGLALHLHLPDHSPTLSLDRLRIRQVLLNLLTNAARWTERGSITVELVRRSDDVYLRVTDTGPGITEADQQRVFQRFTSSTPTGPDHVRGIGLGLPLSKRIVELHGGDMGLDSTPGKGATFWFTLPLAQVADSEIGPLAGVAFPTHLRPPEPVLVLARHDVALQRLLQRHVEGFQIAIANGLADAQLRASELKASAIIADLDAPDVPGTGHVPVVRCPLPTAGRTLERLGVDVYLVKPLSREALRGAIARLGRPVKRVLVVDDDIRFVELLRRMLSAESPDLTVATAHNVEDALDAVLAHAPDLVLLDLAMPSQDGVEFLRRTAIDPRLANVPVFVVSGRDEEDVSVPLGREVRITKPEGFHLAELIDVITAAVSKLTPVRGYLVDTAPALQESAPG